MRRNSSGMSLVELLVVMAIIGVLVAMLLPALSRMEESARLAACLNNMRQMGVALSAFHDEHGKFPECDRLSYYVDLLPFLERMDAYAEIQSHGLEYQVGGLATPVELPAMDLFVCPSRRSSESGPMCDYATGQHPHLFSAEFAFYGPIAIRGPGGSWGEQVNWIQPTTGPGWSRCWSILSGIKGVGPVGLPDAASHWTMPQGTFGTALEEIADGTSNTMMLAHSGLMPDCYMGGGPTDGSWAAPYWYHDKWHNRIDETNTRWSHGRYPGLFGRDRDLWDYDGWLDYYSQDVADPGASINLLMTSPHANMPTLFADGSVRPIGFKMSKEQLGYLWGYNDGVDVVAE